MPDDGKSKTKQSISSSSQSVVAVEETPVCPPTMSDLIPKIPEQGIPEADMLALLPRAGCFGVAIRLAIRSRHFLQVRWPTRPNLIRKKLNEAFEIADEAIDNGKTTDRVAGIALRLQSEYRDAHQDGSAILTSIWRTAAVLNCHQRQKAANELAIAIAEVQSFVPKKEWFFFRRAVWWDVLRLQQATQGKKWSDTTGFQLRGIGPLWPEGPPKSWPGEYLTKEEFSGNLIPAHLLLRPQPPALFQPNKPLTLEEAKHELADLARALHAHSHRYQNILERFGGDPVSIQDEINAVKEASQELVPEESKKLEVRPTAETVTSNADATELDSEIPAISILEQIEEWETFTIEFHTPSLQELQTFLDYLAGKKFGSLEANKLIAEKINSLAEENGVRLQFRDYPVTVLCLNPGGRYKNGRFEVRTAFKERETLYARTSFPSLIGVWMNS